MRKYDSHTGKKEAYRNCPVSLDILLIVQKC